MTDSNLARTYDDVVSHTQWIHRFILGTIGATLCLVGWGGFVTSINAGLAVPDWPTTFNSWNPLNPLPQWWTATPILAEHGHRLIGAVVGILTLILAVWMWLKDVRPGVRGLAVMTLIVVIMQGVLGGLRVVLSSLDLAVVHAVTAHLYFGLLVTLAVMTSRSWTERPDHTEMPRDRRRLARLSQWTTAAILVQIILGALLRHPGAGISLPLAMTHIGGAIVVLVLIVILVLQGLTNHYDDSPLRNLLITLSVILVIQVTLGFTAYFVLLSETGTLIPSSLQVTINSLHVVIGAILWGTSVAAAVWVHGMRKPAIQAQ